jgi:hypothetical protein
MMGRNFWFDVRSDMRTSMRLTDSIRSTIKPSSYCWGWFKKFRFYVRKRVAGTNKSYRRGKKDNAHLFVQGANHVFDRLTQDSGQALAHRSVRERVLMVAYQSGGREREISKLSTKTRSPQDKKIVRGILTTVGRPWRVVGVNTGRRARESGGRAELVGSFGFGREILQGEDRSGDWLRSPGRGCNSLWCVQDERG